MKTTARQRGLGQRWLRRGAALACMLVAVLVLGHAAGTRYAARQGSGSCPFGAGAGVPPRLHRSGGGPIGEQRAVGAALLGLTIGQTKAGGLRGWLAAHGCRCRQAESPLECECLDPDAFGASYRGAIKQTVFATLGADARLKEITLVASFADASAAMAAFAAAQAQWQSPLGPVSHTSGPLTASELDAGLLRQARTE